MIVKIPILQITLLVKQGEYWKARKITMSSNDEISRIVLNLGEFYPIISFNAAIAHIIDGFGLKQIFELIYAHNTVSHMLTGKAYNRAVRDHMFAFAALYATLLQEIFEPEDVECMYEPEVLHSEIYIIKKKKHNFSSVCLSTFPILRDFSFSKVL